MPRPTQSKWWAAILAATPVVFLAGFAHAQAPSNEELQRKIAALEEQVNSLKKSATAPATSPALTTEQVDRAVLDATKDAKKQGDLSKTFTGGYTDGKFVIQSADGAFRFNPSASFQFRYIANYRQEAKNGVAESDDWQSGFEVRRLKFAFNGNLFGNDLFYKFQWATNRKTGAPELDEGWFRYQLPNTPWAIRVGQMPLAFDHESDVSNTQQLAIERSYVHEILSAGAGGDDYVQGVQLRYEDGVKPLRASLMLTDGAQSKNTNFQDGGGGLPFLGLGFEHWGANARVDYKLSGDWKEHYDFNNFGVKQDLLVIGGGADYEDADNATAFIHTFDIHWKSASIKGLSAYAAYVGIYRDFRNITTGAGITENPYDWGVTAQVGYFVSPQVEVYARYSFANLDKDAPGGTNTIGAAARIEDQIQEITVGFNYFIYKHNLKITVDGVYLPNGSPVGLDGAGILGQPNNKEQFILRSQVQLLF